VIGLSSKNCMFLPHKNIFIHSFVSIDDYPISEVSNKGLEKCKKKYSIRKRLICEKYLFYCDMILNRFATRKPNFHILNPLELNFDIDGEEESVIKTIFGSTV
jgi:hypothetical protein